VSDSTELTKPDTESNTYKPRDNILEFQQKSLSVNFQANKEEFVKGRAWSDVQLLNTKY